jgi:hypothetical protein
MTPARTPKQRRRAEKKARRAVLAAAHVRTDWEYTGLMLVRCERCGLEQTGGIGDEQEMPCVVCGSAYGTFAGWFLPDPLDVPRILGSREDEPFVLGRAARPLEHG